MEVLTLQQAGFLAWSKSKKNKGLFVTKFPFFQLISTALGCCFFI